MDNKSVLTCLGKSFHSSNFLPAYGNTLSLMICRVVNVMSLMDRKYLL